MPVLNPEVLTDVLIECLMKDNDSRTLGKFILSGREPFRAAINYFKKAKSVKINGDCMVVSVIYGDYIRYHKISYQFSMVNLIMKTIAPRLDKLVIFGCPRHFKAIEFFLEHKIKKVQVFQNLPQRYQQLLASNDFIEKITIILDGYRDMNMIPNSCRELKFKFAIFEGEEMNQIMIGHKEWFENTEKLEIEASTFWTKLSISTMRLDHFPNLQTIDAVATYEDDMRYVIGMIKDQKLSFLKRFANSNITGKLVFKNRISPNSRKAVPDFEQVLEQVKDIAGVTANEEEQTITRIVELKENLIAEFILVFSVDDDN